MLIGLFLNVFGCERTVLDIRQSLQTEYSKQMPYHQLTHSVKRPFSHPLQRYRKERSKWCNQTLAKCTHRESHVGCAESVPRPRHRRSVDRPSALWSAFGWKHLERICSYRLQDLGVLFVVGRSCGRSVLRLVFVLLGC